MKILLSNHSLVNLGGSETWVKCMHDELAKNHEVHVATPQPIKLWPEMNRWDPETTYDLSLLNHMQTVKFLLSPRRDIGIKIHTSHGIIPQLELPQKGADYYVGVSDEVKHRNETLGFKTSVIFNPINMDRFTATKPVNDSLKNILVISNNPPTVMKTILEAAGSAEVRTRGRGTPSATIEEDINWADMVLSLGRGALEAMSCERNVVSLDYRGGDGFVTPDSVFESRKNNFSGRRYKRAFDVDELKEEFAKYDPSLGPKFREYIAEHHSVDKIVKQYLTLALGHPVNKE